MKQLRIFCHGLTVYSFLGWILEGLHQMMTKGHFSKPNFLWGPFKPMYGWAAMFLLMAQKLGRRVFALAAILIPSGVEYISAFWLKKDFGLTYWDYSGEKGNVKGFICLKFSLYWGMLAYVLVTVLHPKLVQLQGIRRLRLQKIVPFATWIYGADLVCTLLRRYHKSKIVSLRLR